MSVQKYLTLKRVYCRVHHLLQGFDPFLDKAQVQSLNYDLVEVAKLEEERGLLSYIIVK